MTRDDMPENSELTPRQAEILQLVGEHGYATLETLSQRFDVSVQSIRRDIIQLDKLRLLQRFHGGAGPMDSTVRLGYAEKTMRAAAAKERIGRSAANLVPDGAAIFLDVGTTFMSLVALRAAQTVHLSAPERWLRSKQSISISHSSVFPALRRMARSSTTILKRSQSSRRQCVVLSSRFWLVIIRSLPARQSPPWGAPAISPILSPILRLRIFSCLHSPKQSSKSSKQVDGSDLQNGTVASGNHIRRFSSLLLRLPTLMRALRSTGVTNRQSI